MPPKKKLLFTLLTITGSLLLSALIAETLSNIYLRQITRTKESPFSQSLYQATLYTPHPYFGFVRNPESTFTFIGAPAFRINRDGFIDKQEVPEEKLKDTITVGFFGGSFGEQLFIDLDQNPPLKLKFEEAIRQKFPNRSAQKVRLLDFTIAGSKQPQQFAVAAHYSHLIDVAITIDGMNEIRSRFGRKFPIYYPNLSGFFYSASSERYMSLNKAWQLQNTLLNVKKFLASTCIENSATAQLAILGLSNYVQRRLAELSTVGEKKEENYYQNDMEEKKYMRNQANTWERYLNLQFHLLASQGVKSFFFLQPSPHSPESHPLTPEEKTMIESDELHHEVQLGYVYLKKSTQNLKERGVPIFDLTNIYQNMNRKIYRDPCCHVIQEGSWIAVEEIIRAVQSN